ncbi:MAG: hypothetical protein KatS3mg094_039 [Candidatus Parcubacteria bacterium]|nr:MAG: hypothetical protein KatS3mg094_039 [Candidatus Parcubacteria bacterium]
MNYVKINIFLLSCYFKLFLVSLKIMIYPFPQNSGTINFIFQIFILFSYKKILYHTSPTSMNYLFILMNFCLINLYNSPTTKTIELNSKIIKNSNKVI